MTFRIRTLNSISNAGLSRLPKDAYVVGTDVEDPDAIILRSAKLHGVEIPDSLLAVARAGAGVNNIPVAEYSARGIPVFNTPGANANAVKELVVAALFLAARNLIPAAAFAHRLDGDAESMDKAVESGKKEFVGFELPGRILGVIGLGAIGVEVANAASALGMRVMGALLISSLIIFPALTAMRVCKHYRSVILCAVAVSVISFVLGMTVSFLLATPAGASIVIVDIAMYLIFWAAGAIRGRLA